MDDSQPLCHRNPQGRFTDRATDYAQHRPSYPREAIALILQEFPSGQSLQAADVGAGTGISARFLANQGVQVWAIEPNPAMIAAATPHPLVTYHPGTAEQTGLPAAGMDLVCAFQAFHWFDPLPALREFRRVLKPDGRLALVWNNRDRQDPFTGRYSDIVRQSSGHHPAEADKDAAILLESPEFAHLRCHSFSHHQPLNQESLLGRATSVSYLPQSGPIFAQFKQELEILYQEAKDDLGLVYLRYRTDVYLANPVV